MAIVAAGPFFNLLLAVFIFLVFFAIVGVEDIRSVVKSVAKESPAARAGFQLEDRIVAVNTRDTESWYDIKKAVIASNGAPLLFTVKRDGELFEIQAAPEMRTGRDILGDEVEYYDVGISGLPVIQAIIGEVSKGFPAERAGLKKGDRIIGINDVPVHNWEEMRTEITASGGNRLRLKIQRGNAVFQAEIVPELTVQKDRTGNKVERYLIGISTGGISIPEELRLRKRLSPPAAFIESIKQTWFVIDITLRGIIKMIDGSISRDNLGGPIMIAQMAGQQAKAGIGKLIQFIAFISINLAILNFLPIPILDGGHLMFFSIEAIRGRPVSIRVREIAQQAGMFILLLLMVFVFYNDIARIFS
jgi:regulator of sigma E protease